MPSGLGIAPPTVERFDERARRLYEQGADAARIDQYVRRWWQWVRAGIDSAIASCAYSLFRRSVVDCFGSRVISEKVQYALDDAWLRSKTVNRV